MTRTKGTHAKAIKSVFGSIDQPLPNDAARKGGSRGLVRAMVVAGIVLTGGGGAVCAVMGHTTERDRARATRASDAAAATPGARPLPATPLAQTSARPPSTATPEQQVHSAPREATKAPRGVPPFTYARYGNPRFRFFTDYPTFMTAEPEPANGDGQCWAWESRARVCASGIHNTDGDTPKVECDRPLEEFRPSGELTYRHASGDTCVKSGTQDGKIFWTRYTYAHDNVYHVDFEYDESLKAAFDPIVARLNERLNVDAGG